MLVSRILRDFLSARGHSSATTQSYINVVCGELENRAYRTGLSNHDRGYTRPVCSPPKTSRRVNAS